MQRIPTLCIALLLTGVLVGSPSELSAQDASWFNDVSSAVGLDSVPAWRLYVTDVNGDQYPDLVIINGIYKRGQLSLWVNLPDPENSDERIFVDMTEESGINDNPDGSITDGRVADVGALADVDNDGDVDLVTARFYYNPNDYKLTEDKAAVMLNDGSGHFTHVTNNGLDDVLILNATGLGFLDYDLDGILDLYVGTFSIDHQFSLYQNDMLFRGNGDGTFSDVTKPSGIERVSQPLYGMNVADWNNDGWPDVITAPYCRTGGSLWMNNGDGTFTDVAGTTGYNAQALGGDNGQRLCQWEGMPADFDNDGDIDVLQVMVHGGYNVNEGRTVIAVNQGAEGGYAMPWELDRIRRAAPSTSHIGDMSGSWIDLDNDGRLDLVINQSQYPQANAAGVERSYFMWQNEEQKFDDITADLGLADQLLAPGASEVIDYDLDGDDDLFIVVNTNRNQKNTLRLIENNIGSSRSWVRVALDPPSGVNGDAIGARIMVTADGVTQTQEITAGNGHFGGQQPLIRNFGLGDAEKIEKIEVRWPGIGVQNSIVEEPPLNTLITLGGTSSVEPGAGRDELRVTTRPQPVSSELRVTHLVAEGERSWRIVDVEGRTAMVGTVLSGTEETTIAVDALPAGRYLLIVGEGEGMTAQPILVTRP